IMVSARNCAFAVATACIEYVAMVVGIQTGWLPASTSLGPRPTTAGMLFIVSANVLVMGCIAYIVATYSGILQKKREELAAAKRAVEDVNKRLAEMAVTDGLTRLYNHRYFHEQLAHEVLRARRHGFPLSLLMIDIDDFKEYNDTYGHPAGDQVMLRIASLIAQNLRQTDLAARYGGEEFAVILPSTSLEGSMVIAEKIRQAVEGHPFLFGPREFIGRLTVSAGAATLEVGVESSSDLIRRADEALYRAKKEGKNRSVGEGVIG
ncbi:MAG: GGDEF domain-containing protein, partial [Vicinamibacteria bacterium]